MTNFNSNLKDFFNINSETFDARNLVQALVVYANQYCNYYKSKDCEPELKKEMKNNITKYGLRFIANIKTQIIEDLKPFSGGSKDAYYDSCIEQVREFKTSCKEVCYENWDDLFLVLDWVKDNFNWERGDNYFDSFMRFSENEPTIIHQYSFEDYAEDIGRECYLSEIPKEQKDNNPIFNYIDWKGWAEDFKNEYT